MLRSALVKKAVTWSAVIWGSLTQGVQTLGAVIPDGAPHLEIEGIEDVRRNGRGRGRVEFSEPLLDRCDPLR